MLPSILRRRLRRRAPRPASPTLERKRFLNLASGYCSVVSTSYGPFELLVSPTDTNIGRGVFVRGSKGEGDLTRALALLEAEAGDRPRGTFVDVGANIGTTALAALAEGFEHVVAIEPEPDNAGLLRATVALNRLDARVTVVEAAAGATAGAAVLALHPTNRGGHHVSLDGSAGEQVELVSLDDLALSGVIELDRVGLWWLDTQGYEFQVLSGATAFLERGIPFVFEFSPRRLATRGELDDFCRLVSSRYAFVADVRTVSEPVPARQLGELAQERRYSDLLAFGSPGRS